MPVPRYDPSWTNTDRGTNRVTFRPFDALRVAPSRVEGRLALKVTLSKVEG